MTSSNFSPDYPVYWCDPKADASPEAARIDPLETRFDDSESSAPQSPLDPFDVFSPPDAGTATKPEVEDPQSSPPGFFIDVSSVQADLTNANVFVPAKLRQYRHILDAWFRSHLVDPYPSAPALDDLARRCGLKRQQVRNYLANRRARVSPANKGLKEYWARLAPIRRGAWKSP
jgi:hypothetical protein